jgi:hypothetical protein
MVSFTPLSSSRFYVQSTSLGEEVPYTLAFWATEGGTAPLSLEQSWQQRGLYLFLNAALTGEAAIDLSDFGDRLTEFLHHPTVQHTRFLWIENPGEPLHQWQFHALPLVFANPEWLVERRTFFRFRNYQLALDRQVRCRLTPTGDGFTFIADPSWHHPPGGAVESSKADATYFSTGYGAQRLRALTWPEPSDSPETSIMVLPLAGSQAGCLRLALDVPNHRDRPSFEALAHLDVGFHISFKSADQPNRNGAVSAPPIPLSDHDPWVGFGSLHQPDRFLMAHHRYPFLAETNHPDSPCPSLTLYATLDVLHPLHSQRSYLAFSPPGQPDSTQVSLPSGFRTNLGYTIHLTPQGEDGSRLVFTERPGQNTANLEVPLALVPTGAYGLSVPRYDALEPDGDRSDVQSVDNFLCGIAGIEYIQLSAEHGNWLHLETDHAAFAPDFVPAQVTADNTVEQHLTTATTTAWATITYTDGDAPAAPIYFSQPRQSLLYRATPGNPGTGSTSQPLRFLDVPVTPLLPDRYLPLLPYGEVSGVLPHYQQLEEQLINPQRRRLIQQPVEDEPKDLEEGIASQPGPGDALEEPSQDEAPLLARAESDPGDAFDERLDEAPVPVMAAFVAVAAAAEPDALTVTGTTPQGLLARYSPDFAMLKELVLAKGTDNEEISLKELPNRTPLRAATQSSQLFLVVADPNALLPGYFSENQLNIHGWTFELSPDNWRTGKGDTNTVLILKFLDQPLLELLKDTALWEQPSHFVGAKDADVNGMSRRLVNYFEAAIATVNDDQAPEKEKANAAPLARIATSPHWAGWVALNVNLPAEQGLPTEMRALASGLQDRDNFYAQYVGSNGTPVAAQNQQLVAEPSSLFGLLDYRDNSVPEVGPEGFAIQVASLRVQFQNSQMTAFSSELNLTLDKLFDEKTLLLNSRSSRNIVILQGFAEEHNGVTTYGFSFSGENYFALPSSSVFNTVDIVKAEFSTDPDGGATRGHFTLWGRFNFRAIPELDLFSFGMDPLAAQTNLSFRDFQNHPPDVALQALEYLESRKILQRRLDQLPQELEGLGTGDARTAVAEAQAVVQAYDELVAAGGQLAGPLQTLRNRALKALKALRTLDPESLNVDHPTVQEAVRVSAIDQLLEDLAKNKQYLIFSKLVIHLENQPQQTPKFTFDPSQIGFDLRQSKARSHSLYSKFPLKLVNVVHFGGDVPTPPPKGYLPVKTPLGSHPLPDRGYGLNFELNLGSLGGLSGAANFVVNLMVGWKPNRDGTQDQANVFVGLRLPGIGRDVLGFPLQSVLKLSFKGVELIRDRSAENPAYLLKIKNIALKFFVLSFPPNGQTEIVIFGNPDATDSNDALGWYAAYAKEPAPLPEGQSSSGRASPARR